MTTEKIRPQAGAEETNHGVNYTPVAVDAQGMDALVGASPVELLAALDGARAKLGATPATDALELAEAAARIGLDINPGGADANAARAQAADEALAAAVAVAEAGDGKLPPPWAVKSEGAAMERGRLVATVVVRHAEDVLARARIALSDDKARERVLRRAVATARNLGIPDVPEVALRQALLRLADDVRPDEPESAQAKGAARLLALAREAGAEPFRCDLGDAYLKVVVPDGGCKTVRVRGRECRAWLAHLAWARDGAPASSAALDGALAVLEGTALHAPNAPFLPLAVRVAGGDAEIWYDLGGPDWRAVRCTPDGWSVAPAPPVFKRHSHMAQQVMPTPGGDLGLVLRYLPVPPDAAALLLPWLVAALVPGIPHPVLVLHGPAGTGKTTTMRVIRTLLDPSATEVLTLPHDPAQLVQALAHHYAVPLDNVDRLAADASDALCRAVTGDGVTKRALYTDDDDVVYRYRRVLMVSGVTVVAQKPDLLDRSLLLQLRPIAPADRRQEAEFWAAYQADLPAMMGGLLDALSAAMRLRPQVRLAEHPRLADYAAWAYAAAEALGIGGDAAMVAYAGNVRRQTQEALAAHPVGQALHVLLDARGGWDGPPTALLDALGEVAAHERLDTHARSWPKAPHVLRRRIVEVEHNLLAQGWTVSLDERAPDRSRERRWIIRIAKPAGREKASEASEASEALSSKGLASDASRTLLDDDPVASEVASTPKALPGNGLDASDAVDASRLPLDHGACAETAPAWVTRPDHDIAPIPADPSVPATPPAVAGTFRALGDVLFAPAPGTLTPAEERVLKVAQAMLDERPDVRPTAPDVARRAGAGMSTIEAADILRTLRQRGLLPA